MINVEIETKGLVSHIIIQELIPHIKKQLVNIVEVEEYSNFFVVETKTYILQIRETGFFDISYCDELLEIDGIIDNIVSIIRLVLPEYQYIKHGKSKNGGTKTEEIKDNPLLPKKTKPNIITTQIFENLLMEKIKGIASFYFSINSAKIPVLKTNLLKRTNFSDYNFYFQTENNYNFIDSAEKSIIALQYKKLEWVTIGKTIYNEEPLIKNIEKIKIRNEIKLLSKT